MTVIINCVFIGLPQMGGSATTNIWSTVHMVAINSQRIIEYSIDTTAKSI